MRTGDRRPPSRGARSAIAAALALTVAATACGARQLETADLNRKIAATVTQREPSLHDVVVTCPPSVSVERGNRFTCAVRAGDGFTGTVEVTQTDDTGTLAISYTAPSPGRAAPGSTSPPAGNPSEGATVSTVPASCDPGRPSDGASDGASASTGSGVDQSKVILFTRTAGFHHDSIANAVDALTPALEARGFTVTTTDDPGVFTPDNLRGASAIVFLMTSGDVVNDEQQAAIEQYVRAGGGWAGIHSAADTEYEWPFYETLVGAWFSRHPAPQPGTLVVEDRQHPSVAALPARSNRTEEWYDFRRNPRGCVHVLATVDESTYKDGGMGRDHPIIWCHRVGRGRSWYDARGHAEEAWSDATFIDSVVEGIVSVTPTVPDVCPT